MNLASLIEPRDNPFPSPNLEDVRVGPECPRLTNHRVVSLCLNLIGKADVSGTNAAFHPNLQPTSDHCPLLRWPGDLAMTAGTILEDFADVVLSIA